MRKLITAGLAALTIAGTLAAAGAADAQNRSRRNNDGAVVAAGIAGLAVGAAIASGGNERYYADDYGRRQYRPGYYDGYYYGPRSSAYGYYNSQDGRDYYGPRRCRTRMVYDPYLRARVERTRCR